MSLHPGSARRGLRISRRAGLQRQHRDRRSCGRYQRDGFRGSGRSKSWTENAAPGLYECERDGSRSGFGIKLNAGAAPVLHG